MGLRTRRLGTRLHSFFLHRNEFSLVSISTTTLISSSVPSLTSHCVLQRELQISLLRYTCETGLPAQSTPGRYAVHGPQTTTCSAETEVPRAARHACGPAEVPMTQVSVFLDTEASHVVSGSSQCRSLMPALGRITQVEANHILVQQSRRSLHRANTTSSS